MAFERLSDERLVVKDFGSYIESQFVLYDRQISIRNAEDEANFNEAVLAGNLSLEDQLDWRKKQRKRVKDNKEERLRIKGEIASLKDQIEQKKFSDAYLAKLSSFEAGATSIDSVISFLEQQEGATTDLLIRQTIAQALKDQKAVKFRINKEIIENETQFAINDKSDKVLNDQLEKVRSTRNEAILSGNTLLQTVYDLQVQSLEKAINENSIMRTVTRFAVNTMTDGLNALGLVDAFNSEIANAATGGSVTIGDNTFDSPRDFWNFKRGEYITDPGANGFFPRFSTEQSNRLGLLNAKGNLTTDEIRNSASQFSDLSGRVEFLPYTQQIEVARQNTLQKGADFLSSKIFTDFSNDLNVSRAVTSLNNLTAIGADVSSTLSSVIAAGAQTKQTQVNNILSSVEALLTADPNLTPEQALETAIKTGAGSVLSPEQLVGKTEKEIVSEQITGAEEEEFKVEPRTTAPSVEAPPVVPEPETQEQPPEPAGPRFTFTQQLDRGTRSESVLELQRFLNRAGFPVAQTGPGSPGQETRFFGPLTEKAVQKFQAAQGIVSAGAPTGPDATGFGRVGPKTLEALNVFEF